MAEPYLNGKPFAGRSGNMLNTYRFYNIVLYQILLSCIIGALIGYVARKVLRFAEKHE
jgi:NhaP-type Na+/H+ or K+/H+ antiporter